MSSSKPRWIPATSRDQLAHFWNEYRAVILWSCLVAVTVAAVIAVVMSGGNWFAASPGARKFIQVTFGLVLAAGWVAGPLWFGHFPALSFDIDVVAAHEAAHAVVAAALGAEVTSVRIRLNGDGETSLSTPNDFSAFAAAAASIAPYITEPLDPGASDNDMVDVFRELTKVVVFEQPAWLPSTFEGVARAASDVARAVLTAHGQQVAELTRHVAVHRRVAGPKLLAHLPERGDADAARQWLTETRSPIDALEMAP